ncbi:RNA polymerase sigma factor [Streptomyces sp. NBC_00690]|uniref:RNA polymerase sigma factor n=1 Tax=Streptomyces sp. NBC_00690 TaxID=2975808 RepID=UPI002E2A4473|nr:RNA polymerase sigma factor [Streptomyces sp. NBC_00690]
MNVTTGDQPDDAELLAALRERDRAAFEALYRRYAPWLTARLQYRCADPAELDDIVQEAFLSIWRRCTEGRQPEVQDFAGWLWRIAARRLADAARTHGSRSRIQRALDAFRRSPTPSAEEQALDSGEFGPVRAALSRLPPDLQDVLQATVLDGLTTQQTAQKLRLPTGTVKSRAQRARRRLRAELADGTEPTGPAQPPPHPDEAIPHHPAERQR